MSMAGVSHNSRRCKFLEREKKIKELLQQKANGDMTISTFLESLAFRHHGWL